MKSFNKFLKRRYPNTIYSIRIAILLLLPAFLLRGFTSFYPMFYTGYLSFFNYSPVKGPKEFIGLGNFIKLIGDPGVTNSLNFTIFFTVLSTFIQISLGLVIAIILNQKFFARSAARVVNIIPWAIPAVITGLAAKFAFNAQFGFVNDILYRLFEIRPVWLNSLWASRIAVTFVDVWKYVGFVALVFLASLQGIPKELRDAADVDGANNYQFIFRIVIPLIKPMIIIMTIFTAIWRIASFDLIFTMTSGGPGTATSVVSYKIYEIIFSFINFGYGSALSLFLLIVVLILSGISTIFLRRSEAQL